MGNKVFRIHNDGPLITDWFDSGEINDTLIDSIETDGGNGKNLPTSIPSPFARIDLVRTAFASMTLQTLDGVEKNGQLTFTDNHKLVSDALDIGQILFNYDKHSKNLSMAEWDRSSSLNKLLNSSNASHRHLGKTLELFLQQDKEQYNFDKLDKIYIIKYKHKIIGGTSPRTLFFAAPSAPKVDIKFGQKKALNAENYTPLFQREGNFIKYLYCLSKTDDFNSYFPEFNNYLKITLEKLSEVNHKLFDEIHLLDALDFLNNLKDIGFNSSLGQPLTAISRLKLKQAVSDRKTIERKSDFIIRSSKKIDGIKPLVLPTETFTKKFIYTEDFWDHNTKVPCYDENCLADRKLPDQGDKYPYLTMNDFLSPAIIKLPYGFNEKQFFNAGSNKYLLPLTDLFFKYFSVDDLENQNLISFQDRGAESIEVRLRIPVKNDYVTYCKIYNPKNNSSIDLTDPKGIIVSKSFDLSLYPSVKSSDCQISYALGIAETEYEQTSTISVTPLSDTEPMSLKFNSIARSQDVPPITSQTIINGEFNAIAIKYGDVVNYIVPKFIQASITGGDIFNFAIDFGTTNTHIEYKIEGRGESKEFDITPEDHQISFLLPPIDGPARTHDLRLLYEGQEQLMQEVIPRYIGKNNLVSSPFRTVLLENKNLNYSKTTYTFAHANIGFDYEKRDIKRYLKPQPDLKWSKEVENEERVKHYIEELLSICRNKVLLNRGNVSRTKVVWFYPVSMTTSHLKLFRKIWKKSFRELFGDDEKNLLDYPESIAPFYHYKSKESLPVAAKPSVSIDIGGGTSDIMIYYDDMPQCITSFGFAGNAIFGDGFNGNFNSNGFVSFYLPVIKKILIDNNSDNDQKVENELSILTSIEEEYKSSSDLINFFFSLKENNNLDKHNISIDFTDKLAKSDHFKIIFLLFYSSIVYHVAEYMKLKGLVSPRNIVFSGTGSKTLQIIDSSAKLESVTSLFEEIFKGVYGEKEVGSMNVRSLDNPKQITCKGGIEMLNDPKAKDLKHSDLIEVNLGNKLYPKVQSKFTDNSITYENLDVEYLSGIIDNVNSFYTLFLNLNEKIGFRDEFDISNESLQTFNTLKSNDQLNYLLDGIKQLKVDTVDSENVAQTMFFYPIIGLLYNLAVELSSNT